MNRIVLENQLAIMRALMELAHNRQELGERCGATEEALAAWSVGEKSRARLVPMQRCAVEGCEAAPKVTFGLDRHVCLKHAADERVYAKAG